MDITDIRHQREQRKFVAQYDETAKLARKLSIIISYLRAAMDGKALDWQDRGSVDRAITNLTTTPVGAGRALKPLCRNGANDQGSEDRLTP